MLSVSKWQGQQIASLSLGTLIFNANEYDQQILQTTRRSNYESSKAMDH
jgi:hypothetical protein